MKFEIFYFSLKEGVSRQQAIEKVSQLLNVHEEAAEAIVAKKNRPLSTGLSEAKAEKYLKAFQDAGLNVKICPCSVELNGFSEKPPEEQPPASEPEPPVSEPPEQVSVPSVNDSEHDKKSVQIKFKGNGFEYFKIWIVNIFLTILTLGIYSAWAKVRNKQYFYGNTLIDGSSFQYTAKPLDILKGRAIAVAVFMVYALIDALNPLLGLIFFIVLMVFLPWVVVRSLQFNARNSVFRNIRFNFTGSKKEALQTFLFWPFLIAFTFGLVLPMIWYKQTAFMTNNSAYGTCHFRFNAKIKDYYLMFFKFVLPFILMVISLSVLFIAIDSPLIMSLLPFISLLFYFLLFAYFATALGNLLFNNLTLEESHFTSSLEVKPMLWLYISNTFGIILTLGLFIPWAKVRVASYRAQCLTMQMQNSLDHFVNAEKEKVKALGEQAGEIFDVDLSVF